MTITYEDGILIYNSSQGKRDNLIPITKDLFKLEKEHEEYGEMRIEFILDGSGNVKEFRFLDIIGVMDTRTRANDWDVWQYTITWDSMISSGQSVATGVYLYRFQAGDFVETTKMLLLKWP